MSDTEQTGHQVEAPETAKKTTRNQDLSKKAGMIVVSRGVTIAVQMVSIMVLTRVLSKEDFGIISFLLLAYSTVITVAQLGLPESVFYFFERIPDQARKSFALLTARVLLFIGMGASLILVALNFLAPLWGFAVNGMFFPLILTALLELPTLPLPNILIAIDKTRQAAWLNICTSVLQFSALVVPALLQLPLAVIVYGLAVYGVLRFILSAVLFLRNFREAPEPLPANMIKEQLRYSLPLAFSQILWGLNKQIDKYIVAAFLPVAVYAEYVVGSWEIPFLPAIAYSVASVMMPQFVSLHLKGHKDELLALWCKGIEKVSIVVLPLAILFLIVADEFIALFFSEKYLAAALPFRIYTLIILQRVAAYSSMLKAIGETKVISYSAIYLVAINSVLSIPFVLWLGVAGPPLATLIANGFTWIYTLGKIKNALSLSYTDVFPFKSYFKALSIAALSAVPVFLLKINLDLAHAAKLGVLVVAFFVSYGILAQMTGVVKKEDRDYLLRALKIKAN